MEQANNISEYLKIIERYKSHQLYYRGQLEKYKTIPPTIDRDSGYSSNESKIYYESIQKRLSDFENLTTPLEKLSKLQHYDFPTRLVDLTVDPLIALYFAVENVDDASHGNVYIYSVEGVPFDSKEAKLLSILPTISNFDVNIIKKEYNNIFGELISSNEILEIVNNPIIIQYSEKLKNTNPRLYNQKGTFLICGNKVVDNVITTSLKSLDTIQPTIVIRIPYEYKKEIKKELDSNYNVNKCKIFPELPAVASYIKEKYKLENFLPDGKYKIVDANNISTLNAKRISFKIVLKESLKMNQIKEVVRHLIEKYKEQQDVIWVYVACNEDDYIVRNWILRCQWINPYLDTDYIPITLKYYEEDKCYWDYSESFSTLNDFYNEHIFEDDKKLFVCNQKLWEQFLSIYDLIYNSFQKDTWEEFLVEFHKCQSKITELFIQLQDFGRSHNKKFDDFLKELSYCISPIDDLRYELNDEKISDRIKQIFISNVLTKSEEKVQYINQEFLNWKEILEISSKDYYNIEYNDFKEISLNYFPSFPINKDAIEVQFSINTNINSNKTFHIEGTTNLFNDACLLLSVYKNEQILCQAKTIVKNGKFISPTFSNHQNGFCLGNYTLNITLSIPNTQSDKFISLAGIEYENLSGDFIKRNGIAPYGEMSFTFEIN